MNREEFLKKFKNIIQTETELSEDTNLLDLDEWDSLAMVMTAAFLDKEFGLKVPNSKIQNFDTVKDIMIKAGIMSK
jgi:acyl carrier protein